MDQKDLVSSFFRSSLLELGHISRRLSPHVTSYSKKSFSTLSITRKIRQDLLARENLNNEITTSDIARAFLITNHTGMISLSIAKQKKVMALLHENKLHDNITIGKLFDIVGAVAKDIYNDNAFVYTIWYAQCLSSNRNLKSETIRKRKHIKAYWETEKWKIQHGSTISGLLDNVKGKHQVS